MQRLQFYTFNDLRLLASRRLRTSPDCARRAGARIVEINPAGESFADSRKLAPTIVIGAPQTTRLMREEIFGPLLPIVEYERDRRRDRLRQSRRAAAGALLVRPRRGAARARAQETIAGGVTVNDCLLHFVQEGQPCGGVGASGVGAYHGEWGFRDLQQTEAGVPPVGLERFSAAAAALRQNDRLGPRRIEASALAAARRRTGDERRPARAPPASRIGRGRASAPPARRSAAAPPFRSTRLRPAARPQRRGDRLAVAPPGLRPRLNLEAVERQRARRLDAADDRLAFARARPAPPPAPRRRRAARRSSP